MKNVSTTYDSGTGCTCGDRTLADHQQLKPIKAPCLGHCSCKRVSASTPSTSPPKDIAHQILLQVGRCATPSRGEDPSALYETVIWLVEQLKPQGPMETMVVSQVVANHLITMRELGLLSRESDLQAAGTRASIVSKLQKSFNQHLNLLASLRGLRQQQVRIERIDINGGQAIVGSQVDRGAA